MPYYIYKLSFNCTVMFCVFIAVGKYPAATSDHLFHSYYSINSREGEQKYTPLHRAVIMNDFQSVKILRTKEFDAGYVKQNDFVYYVFID